MILCFRFNVVYRHSRHHKPLKILRRVALLSIELFKIAMNVYAGDGYPACDGDRAHKPSVHAGVNVAE